MITDLAIYAAGFGSGIVGCAVGAFVVVRLRFRRPPAPELIPFDFSVYTTHQEN